MRCGVITSLFFENLAKKFPFLDHSLKVVRSNLSPGDYVKNSFLSAFFFSAMIGLVVLIFSFAFDSSWLFSLLFFGVFFLFSSYFFLNKIRFDVLKSESMIESEIVSTVRFLILELKSERSLYGAIKHASNNFALIGIYFDEVIDKVKLGKTLDQSLNEVVEICPSAHLRGVFWQLLNSLQTGADVTSSLKTHLDDIIEAQKIRVEEYGRELNAFSLFYMMIAIIIPTIGFTIVSAVLTFVGISLSLGFLIFLWIFLSLIQYFFLKIISNRRPSVEAY